MESIVMLFDTQVAVFSLGGLIILLVIWIIVLEMRMKKLLRGKDAKSLEDTISHIIREQDEAARFRAELEQYLDTVENRVRGSLRGIKTIRFNPFKGTGEGGNQSFATAFLSEDGDGVIFSSLYTRERVSMYAKPVQKFESSYDLSTEEETALKHAKEDLSLKKN